MGSVHVLQLPRSDPSPTGPQDLNLSPMEVKAAAGDYSQPKRQLQELHARGFARAYISKVTGRVVLERAHYEAVVRGQFAPAPEKPGTRTPIAPNRAGLADFFSKKRKQ